MEIFRAVIHFILQHLGAWGKISPLNTHTSSWVCKNEICTIDYRIDCAGCSAWCALKLHEQNSRCSPRMLSLCKILTELLFYVALYKEVEEKYAGEMRCGRNYNATHCSCSEDFSYLDQRGWQASVWSCDCVYRVFLNQHVPAGEHRQ